MRVWDLNPSILCRKHLLGEHREIHAIYTVLSEGKRGYSRHPETLRWKGKLPALHFRHAQVAAEMIRRGYNHASPMRMVRGSDRQLDYVDAPERQIELLRGKGCECRIDRAESKEG